ncbi:hypothetical protein LCGC14_0411730 [marine sediment metagenome]|uniref:Uncharacterized protein n=1 Tax=marine sediment metagenome TaxID=412755 RepID=A0A0F9VFK8_9ZZZZ
MKYHFIYPDIGTGFYPGVHHGLAQLFSVLEANGDEVSLHHVTKTPKPSDIQDAVQREMPDIVGFTAMSNQIGYVKLWSRWIKEKYDIPIVCGGVHATLNPGELLAVDSIDMVCVGEGERAVVDRRFLTKHLKTIAALMDNPYPLIEDLDGLPYPDYSLFDPKVISGARGGTLAVMCSRGCLYNCSYCCNHALREAQKGLGKYFRYRSVDNTIGLLEELVGRHQVRRFSFADDIFGANREWILEFCEKYTKKVGLPFDCNLRVEMVTSGLLAALSGAGCSMVELGIESGSEWMREEVLNRGMSNQQIVDAFKHARRVGLRTRAYNMIGLPFETPEMARETIELNKLVNPDEIAVFYFYPFKGTKLYNLCQDEGFLTERETTSYVSESVLHLSTITPRELDRVYSEFYQLVIDRQLRSFPAPVRYLFRVGMAALGIFGRSSAVKIVRKLYMRLFPLLSLLRRSG